MLYEITLHLINLGGLYAKYDKEVIFHTRNNTLRVTKAALQFPSLPSSEQLGALACFFARHYLIPIET